MLIGRLAERRALARLVAGARVSESGALLLVGEPGQGKTALLTELAVQSGGLRTLWVRGSEAERTLPFSGLDQLLRPLLELRHEIPAPQARAVEVALALGPGAAPDRFAISAATLSLLSLAAEERPTLVLVDDAHTLDRASAEALAFVARRVLADRLALVVASRPLSGVLLDAGLPRLELTGLNAAEVTALLRDRSGTQISAALGARVQGATAGNPLAVVEVARNVEALETQTPAATVAVPHQLVASYLHRVTALAPHVRTALLVAALAGDSTRVPAVLAQLGLGLDDLRAAELAGLITLGGGGVEFCHPLARASVPAVVTAQQRRDAHLAIAAQTADADRRAWHLAEGTVGLDGNVADEVAAAATRALRRGAYSVAASAFEAAAALTPSRGLRAARLLAAGEAASLAGRGTRASALLDQAANEAGDPLHRAKVDAVRAVVEQRWGSLERSRDLADRAFTSLIAVAPDAAAQAAGDLVQACLYLGDTSMAMRRVPAIESLVGRCSPGTAVRARLIGGIAQVLAGQDGLAAIGEATAALAATADGDDELRPTWLMMGPLFTRDGSSSARELVARFEQRLRDGAALGALAGLLLPVARYATLTNRWDEARAKYLEGIALARESGQSTDLALLLAGLAWLEARSGGALCRDHAAEATALAARHHVHLATVWATWARGDLALASGDPAAALAHFQQIDQFVTRIGFRHVEASPAPEIVDTLLRLGDLDQGASVARSYQHRAEEAGNPWARARAERAAALVATDPEAGLRRAARLQESLSDQFETARTQLALGELLRRGKRRIDARTALRAALTRFEHLGAEPWSDQAARELQATGEHAHRRSDRTIDLLTPQELQVARLLADGHTTKQAAAAMFLSPKTVEYHLRHVYTKLEIHSRTALADALRR